MLLFCSSHLFELKHLTFKPFRPFPCHPNFRPESSTHAFLVPTFPRGKKNISQYGKIKACFEMQFLILSYIRKRLMHQILQNPLLPTE
jgi:hypothetical protein